MLQLKKYQQKTLIIGLIVSGLLAGCQPSKPTEQKAASDTASSTQTANLPLIQAQTVPIKLASSVVCESDECTNYDLKDIKSNVDWIDQYFNDRLKKDVPLAFKPSEKSASSVEQSQINQNQYEVRYLGQNANIASFVLNTLTYQAGSAHGLYHQDYVVFDLNTKQRIMADQLVEKDKTQQVIDALFEANPDWLAQHKITKDQLQLSDNFYYGVNGIVFAYPVGELASYAEGMTELNLPYNMAKDFIKPEYLPK